MMKSERLSVKIGKRVRRERSDKGISLPLLADMADVSKGLVSQLENGKRQNPTIETLFRLSNALRIPLARLIE